MGRLTEQLGTSVYLDTNIIIYAVEGYETHAAPIKSLLQGLTEREIIAVTSELTVAEVLVKPKRDGNAKLEDAYHSCSAFVESEIPSEKVTMVVPVFITSCQVSEKWNSGPEICPDDEYSQSNDERTRGSGGFRSSK
jgi:hypothetical protein